MEFINAFEKETELISQYGKNSFFTVWAMGLYLDTPDLAQLAEDYLTDCSNDKKIDFLKYDSDEKILYIVQGYFSEKIKDSAKANKASDLNTAVAWLLNGEIIGFPLEMRDTVKEIRTAINSNELSQIELIYAHNCGESAEVDNELKTVVANLKDSLKNCNIDITYKELGNQSLERLYLKQVTNIVIKETIVCPFPSNYEIEHDTNWKSCLTTVSGTWLRDLYSKYQSRLFSANYRDFLGINKRNINKGIKSSAERHSSRFWVYNNGITIITTNYKINDGKILLDGISIINGAQTTGSLGQIPGNINLDDVRIMTRIIECSDPDLITDIVKFNNTQNKITAWDSYANDEFQTELCRQFEELNQKYSYKRGFESYDTLLNIENCIQPLLAFVGKYKDANRSKNTIFETRSLYNEAYEKVKARHVLLVYCLSICISEIKKEYKAKIKRGEKISSTEKLINEALSPLNAKYFILAIIANVIMKLNTDFNDLKSISFVPDVSNTNISDLIQYIKSFISMTIKFIVTYDRDNGVYSHYENSNEIESIANYVETQLSIKTEEETSPNTIEKFMFLICNG